MENFEIVAIMVLAAICGYAVMHFLFRGGKMWKDSAGFSKGKGSKSSKKK